MSGSINLRKGGEVMQVTITDNSQAVLDALPPAKERALEAIGMQAEANAKIEVTRAVYDTPESKSGYRRTGALRNSISHAYDADKAYVGTNLEYAVYVEMGTSQGGRSWVFKGDDGEFHVTKGMPPRPFIRPAVENYMDEYKALAEEMLRS
jgi:phage gpG-like protein